MASLTNNKIKDTYQSLVKFNDNGNITTSAKRLTDGFGNNSPFFVSTTQIGIGVTPTLGYDLHVNSNTKIGGNLEVGGNLTVSGTLTYLNVEDLATEDPLIKLARNNADNLLDIGFYGKYVESTVTKYKGLFNDADDNKWKLFIGTSDEPTTIVNTSGTGYTVGTLVANLEGNVTGGTISGTTGNFINQVTIPETPTADGHAASKKYVDDQIADVDTAKRLEVTVKNVSGGSLAKGVVVHAAPTATPPSGNVIEVIAADANDAAKMPSIGILNETIADQAEGEAVMFGTVQGIDTSGFSIGDELYVSETAGEFTATKPTAYTSEVQKIAVVIKSHASNGLIKVFGAGRANDVPNRIDRNVNFTDSSLLSFGNGVDFYQYHDGTNSYVKNYTGDLIIEQNADDKDIIFKSDNGSGGTAEYFKLWGLISSILISKDVLIGNDTAKLKFGASQDLEIYHDGTNSVINNKTGDLQIYNNADDKDIVFLSDNGSGGTATYYYLDGSEQLNRFLKNILIPDNVHLSLGGGFDLKLYHDGTNSHIINTTGDLTIDSQGDDLILKAADDALLYVQGTDIAIQAVGDGKVGLRYNNVEKLATASNGVIIYEDLLLSGTTPFLSIDGSTTAGIQIHSPSGAKTNMDARDSGTGAMLHKWNRNSDNTAYNPYYENWYDGNSYHSIGVQGDLWRFSDGLVVSGGASFTDPVTIYDVDATENPRLSIGRQAAESLQFDVQDIVATIRHKQDSDSNADHSLDFIIDSSSTGNKLFRFKQAGNTSSTYLTLDSSCATFYGDIDVNSFVEIGEDGTYPTNYGAVGFGGRTNGYPRIFGGLSNKHLYLTSGTGGDIKIRVNGNSTNVVTIASDGNATFGGDATFAGDVNAVSFNGNAYLNTTSYQGGEGTELDNSDFNTSGIGTHFRWVNSNEGTGADWKKVADVVITNAITPNGVQLEAKVYKPNTNTGQTASLHTLYYSISFRGRIDDSSTYNDAIVYGPDADMLRVYKTADYTFELQAKTNDDNRDLVVEVNITSKRGGKVTPTTTLVDGTLTGGTAYTATTNNTNKTKFAGDVSFTGATFDDAEIDDLRVNEFLYFGSGASSGYGPYIIHSDSGGTGKGLRITVESDLQVWGVTGNAGEQDQGLYVAGGVAKLYDMNGVVLETVLGGVDITGDLDVAGDLTIGTNDLTAGTATIGGILLQDSSDRSGLLEINRLGSTGWTGIQIKHGSDLWSIMGNTSDFGIYHDVRAQWIMLHNDGGTTEFYYLGNKKLEVTSTGISVTGTVTGDVTGDLTGNVTGDLTGSVTGAASLNVLKAGDTMTGDLNFNNTVKAQFKTSGGDVGLKIQSSNTSSYIDNEVDNLYIRQKADNKDIIFQSDDGSGGVVEYFRVDGSESRVVYGRSIHMADNVSIILGNDDDGLIRYDSTAGRILQTGVTQFSTTIYAQGDILQGSSTSKFTNGSYLEIGTGASNTAQLTFNADYDGGQTSTYTPHYSGASGAGMTVIKMPSGGVGGLDFYVKNHGTTSGSHNLSTFTKILQLHQDGYSTFAGNVVIGSVDSVVTGLNIGEASPTIQLFDTTNDGKLLMYMQDSSAVIGTYSNHTLNLFSNSTLALTIDTSQRVGVGTSTPSDYYTGADNLVIYQASGEAGITVATATDTTGSLYFADGTTGNAEYRGGIFYNHNTDTFGLVSGGASRVTLDVNGNATFAGTLTTKSIIPDTDSTYNIGTSAERYANIYADNIHGSSQSLSITSNDTFSGTYSLLWHSGETVYSSSFMTINGSTDTLSVPNISVTSGGLTVSGNSVVDKGTNIDRGDMIFEITEFDDTNSLRTKLNKENTAITRVDDSTAPDGGCWQLEDLYENFTIEKFIKVHPGQEYIFETWIKFVSGTDTDQRLYLGASFYDENKDYLGNSYRYWGESALQVDADSKNDGWYHTAGTLGPNQANGTGSIPTAARWMKLIMLVNYSSNNNTIRLCGTRCYHSGGIGKQMITSLYRKSIGSTVGSSAGDWVGTKVMDTSGNLFHPDGVKSYFGTGNDLQIYHDGSNSYVDDSGVGNLRLRGNAGVQIMKAASTELMGEFIADAGVKLYYDNSLKFETLTDGAKVLGAFYIDDYITHTTDGDTKFGFPSTDNFRVDCGGVNMFGVNATTVFLKYAGNNKLVTTSTGISVTGEIASGRQTITSSSDNILTLDQTGGGWNYIEFESDSTRNFYVGQDSGENFVIGSDNGLDFYFTTFADIRFGSSSLLNTGNILPNAANTYTFGNSTLYWGDVQSRLITMTAAGDRTKFRVWSGSTYGIGMTNGFNYGHLANSEYAMTFQMNSNDNRGFWWGDVSHSNSQGAMSLTTNGRLTVATSISIGQGESVTSPSTTPLYVAGSGEFQPAIAGGDALVTIAQTNSNAYIHAGLKINAGNTNPFYIYQSGSSNTLRFNYNSLSDAGGQMVITDSGNVGIGISDGSSPSEKLHIQQNTTDHLVSLLEQDNASYEAWYEAKSQNSGYVRFGISTDANAYAFFNTSVTSYNWYHTGGGLLMTLNSNGHLGLGITNLTFAKLAVNGATYSSGGTFNAGTDTVTNAAFVIDEEDWIYTRDSSQYARKLIGKTNDIIQIGQSGTSLIQGIEFYSGSDQCNYKWYRNTSVAMQLTASGSQPYEILDVKGRIQAETDNGNVALISRTIDISYQGATGTYDFDPVALFGANKQGGYVLLEVNGWQTRFNAGYIHWRNNGGTGTIGSGGVTYRQIAWSGSSSGAGVTVSTISSSTNVIRISFSGWHSNSHGWKASIIWRG